MIRAVFLRERHECDGYDKRYFLFLPLPGQLQLGKQRDGGGGIVLGHHLVQAAAGVHQVADDVPGGEGGRLARRRQQVLPYQAGSHGGYVVRCFRPPFFVRVAGLWFFQVFLYLPAALAIVTGDCHVA